jgi:hypothetical protein
MFECLSILTLQGRYFPPTSPTFFASLLFPPFPEQILHHPTLILPSLSSFKRVSGVLDMRSRF